MAHNLTPHLDEELKLWESEGEGEVALSQVFTKWNGQESEKEGGEGVFIPTPEIKPLQAKPETPD